MKVERKKVIEEEFPDLKKIKTLCSVTHCSYCLFAVNEKACSCFFNEKPEDWEVD